MQCIWKMGINRRFSSPLLFAAPAFQRHAREPKDGSQKSFKVESS